MKKSDSRSLHARRRGRRLPESGIKAGLRLACYRRGIEAASAVSLIALTSFSQAWALSIGELNVASALGEPLRASLRIDTTARESLNARCVRLSAAADTGFPNLSGVALSLKRSLGGATLTLSGRHPMREPMSEMTLTIECPGAPALTRSFLVLLDPPTALVADSVAGAAAVATGSADNRMPRDRRAAARRQRIESPTTPIEPGSVYVVQPGDVLSGLAARVAGRPEYSVWPIAQRIFDTNPNAFDGPDPDTLLVGAAIDIPPLTGMLATRRSGISRRAVVVNSPAREASSRSAVGPSQVVRPTPDAPAARAEATPPVPASPAPASRPPAPRRMVAQRTPVAVRPSEPTRFVLSAHLSSLSLDRLRQRRSGKIDARAQSVLTAPEPARPAVIANDEKATTPAVERPAAQVVKVVTTSRHWLFDWLWLIGGLFLGMLFTAFGMRGWLAQQREAQEKEVARSRRHQQRLDETRRARPDDKAPAIVVLEELPKMDFTAASAPAATVDEPREPASTSTSAGADAPVDDVDDRATQFEADGAVTDSLSELTVTEIQPREAAASGIFEEPNESDLELLARDYAQSTGDVGVLDAGLDLDFAAAPGDTTTQAPDAQEARDAHAPEDPARPESLDDLSMDESSPLRVDLEEAQTSELKDALDLDLDATRALLAPDQTLGPEEMAALSDGTQIIASPLDLELTDAFCDDSVTARDDACNRAAPSRSTAGDAAALIEDSELTEVAIEFDEALLRMADDLEGDDDEVAGDLALEEDVDGADLLTSSSDETIAGGGDDDVYHVEDAAGRENAARTFDEELEEDQSKILSFHRWQDKSGGSAG